MVKVSEDKEHGICGLKIKNKKIKKEVVGWGSLNVLSFSLTNHHSINVPHSYSFIYYQCDIFQLAQ
jgi:hypothetical protein